MEDFSVRADTPMKVAPPVETGRSVLAAINAQESKWFLEDANAAAGKCSGFSLINPGDGGGQGLTSSEIMRLNPEVLLTCWSTPSLPEAWLESGECRLRYICHLTGSVRHIVPRGFVERGGLVTNWGSIPSATVAEQALLLAMAALRNLGYWQEIFNRPGADSRRIERLHTRTLFGSRVGIHGFGQVARALVELLAPFRVAISAYSPGVPPALFNAAGVRQVSNLGQLFAESDVVFECEGLTPRTRESVQAADLAVLPDDAVLVNVARAGLINDAALLREAASGRIRVALDVFDSEPLRADSPWLRTPGVVLSPHIAGPTYDQYPECTRAAFDNLRRYFEKQPLESVVSLEIYDRST
jgi:phosphoglycerate dehydrogenase-like enzyme